MIGVVPKRREAVYRSYSIFNLTMTLLLLFSIFRASITIFLFLSFGDALILCFKSGLFFFVLSTFNISAHSFCATFFFCLDCLSCVFLALLVLQLSVYLNRIPAQKKTKQRTWSLIVIF